MALSTRTEEHINSFNPLYLIHSVGDDKLVEEIADIKRRVRRILLTRNDPTYRSFNKVARAYRRIIRLGKYTYSDQLLAAVQLWKTERQIRFGDYVYYDMHMKALKLFESEQPMAATSQ